MNQIPSKPLISVVTPAFRPRGAQAFFAAIAANELCESAEWIVVDDGSGPHFDALFDSLAAEGVRVIRLPENRGQAAARNVGLRAASGALIKFLDMDDRLSDGHIAALLASADSLDKKAIPFAPTLHSWPSGAQMRNESWRSAGSRPEAQLARLLHAPFLHHCGALFPRALLLELGGYDEALRTDEDGDLLIRVLLAGYSFVAVPEADYIYTHTDSVTRVSSDDDLRKIEARLAVCEKTIAALEETGRGLTPEVRVAMAQRMDQIAMACWALDPACSRSILARAHAVCPTYPLPGRWPVRLARRIGGPDAAKSVMAVARLLRGRLAGGVRG
ncbi:glycosyltransferase family 2 protein [Tropicimonas isoalkanivorans]|uniref:glycosyltransferase family 2 protein n=1 Tax=Tropicimonas isoalkanivorans TaxID=441112 RepID=UPI0015A5BB7C|nr:glycosyltransferase [Tropicimonas isoalkanivorans]